MELLGAYSLYSTPPFLTMKVHIDPLKIDALEKDFSGFNDEGFV